MPLFNGCLMIKPLNIDYNPSRLGQNNEQLSSNLESNSPIYIQCLLIKTFRTCYKIFDPTTSATAKCEKCAYGPTLNNYHG